MGNNVVVQGTVGQGKSIFFRYLASLELTNAVSIPLFVELRKIPSGSKLVDFVIAEMKVLGFDVDVALFEFLSSNGKLILLLDGFDEVPIEARSTLLAEIETLAKRFENLRILVSSRPDSGIENSSQFRVVKLSPLAGGEYADVVRRISHSRDAAASVLAGVNNSTTSVTARRGPSSAAAGDLVVGLAACLKSPWSRTAPASFSAALATVTR